MTEPSAEDLLPTTNLPAESGIVHEALTGGFPTYGGSGSVHQADPRGPSIAGSRFPLGEEPLPPRPQSPDHPEGPRPPAVRPRGHVTSEVHGRILEEWSRGVGANAIARGHGIAESTVRHHVGREYLARCRTRGVAL